jgi:hypothetical protein
MIPVRGNLQKQKMRADALGIFLFPLFVSKLTTAEKEKCPLRGIF